MIGASRFFFLASGSWQVVFHFQFLYVFVPYDLYFCQDLFTAYARLQLNLERDIVCESSLVDQLVEVVCKELDQSSMSSSGNPWSISFPILRAILSPMVPAF